MPEFIHDMHDDIKDGYICARIAYEFNTFWEGLVDIPKDLEVPEREGWIWYLGKELEQGSIESSKG
jgi:hypothetical protein